MLCSFSYKDSFPYALGGTLSILDPGYTAYERLREGGYYYTIEHLTMEEQSTSDVAIVFFIRDATVPYLWCLKMWQKSDNQLYKTQESAVCKGYLLEGWRTNPRFAKGVYVGIVLVEEMDNQHIRLGPLIEAPDEETLDSQKGYEYALVMHQLNKQWRLDYQLTSNKFGNRNGMVFLGKKVAQMHQNLHVSSFHIGGSKTIGAKLAFNIGEFTTALNMLVDEGRKETYAEITVCLQQAYKKYDNHFQSRYIGGHVKRCHGDLKVTNLWLRPFSTETEGEKTPLTDKVELLALDCVDFNQEFCHIDTLSDVAMLAIDLQASILAQRYQNTVADLNCGQSQVVQPTSETDEVAGLIYLFLKTYLEEAQEQVSEAISLLEYYMTEKAMVCAYICLLYDKHPANGQDYMTWGLRYMDIALWHSRHLKRLLLGESLAGLLAA